MSSTNYPYREDGILPDGSRVPDIPIVTFLIIRRDLGKGLVGESIVDEISKPVLPLGMVEVFCPVDSIDLSEDVIVGRAVLDRLRLQLNGQVAKLFLEGSNS